MNTLKRSFVFVLLCGPALVAVEAWAQAASDQSVTSDLAVTYQINARHTGATLISGLRPPLKIKWSVDLGATVSYPLIANGKVYVLAGCDGAGKVNLYALNGLTGAIDWGPIEILEGAYCWAAAAYDHGMVFVVPDSSSPFGSSGAMFAFDANDGHQIWSVLLSGQYLFSSPPTALNGIVYTGGAGVGGTVYAVRESDGTALWTGSVENGDSSSPVVTSSTVFVSYVCPQTYAFNAASGQQIWHYSGSCEGGGGNTSVLYAGSLYVRDVDAIPNSGLALDAVTGTVTSSFSSLFAPAFRGKTAFYTQSNTLAAVNILTGATVWTSAPRTGDSYTSAPIVVNDFVYIGTASGHLLGYEAATGKHVLSINVGAPISAYDGFTFGASPTAGLGAGQGLLVVPASTRVVALSQ